MRPPPGCAEDHDRARQGSRSGPRPPGEGVPPRATQREPPGCDAQEARPEPPGLQHQALRKGSSEEPDVLFNQGLVNRPALRVELVEKLHEQPMAATALELRADGYVDLGRETLILPLELLNQVLVQGYGYLAFS